MPSFEDVLLLCAAAFGQGSGLGDIEISVFIALRKAYGERISGNLKTWDKDRAAVLQWCRTMGQAARTSAGDRPITDKDVQAAAGGCPYCAG